MNEQISTKQTRTFPPEFTVFLGDTYATFHGPQALPRAEEYVALLHASKAAEAAQ